MIGVSVLIKMEKPLMNAKKFQMKTDFKNQIIENNKILWTEILDTEAYDELIYKLTLKFLRRDGYDIGNHKIPEVKSFTP